MKLGKFSLWLILLASIWSCEDQTIDSIANLEVKEEKTVASTNWRITSQLSGMEDMPFTLTNMQKAYQNLLNNPTAFTNGKPDSKLVIQPTHFYCVFTPEDTESVDLLFSDPLLDVSEEPLTHREDNFVSLLPNDGASILDDKADNYFDNEQLVYYATIPVNHKMPDVPYSVLEYFYFPPEDLSTEEKDPTSATLSIFNPYAIEMLELEAMKLTYNVDEEDMDGLEFIDQQYNRFSLSQVLANGSDLADLSIDYTNFINAKSGQRRRRWTAEGWLSFEEGVFSGTGRVQPLMGALVKVRKWGFLVIGEGHTNRVGYYNAGRPRTKYVKYAVYFENKNEHFAIRAESRFVQAKHRDRRRYKRQGYSQYFTSGSRNHFYAMVCNAAFDYTDRIVDQYNLFSPIPSSNRTIPLVAKFSKDVSSQFVGDLLIYPYIRISRIRRGAYRGSDGVYATTIHELTHAGHYQGDTGFFINFRGDRKHRLVMRESWAEGVETIITNDRYTSINPAYRATNRRATSDILWNDDMQRETVNRMTKYTPLVIDLVDDVNQNIPYTASPVDRVSGYSLWQIQNALNNSRDLNTWQDKLNSWYTNPSRGVLNDVFNYARSTADRL